MRNPCIGCRKKFDRCTRVCAIFRAFQDREKERREKIRAERSKESRIDGVRIASIAESKRIHKRI